MAKKQTIKPYNAGTMTESAFFSWIRSTLRRASMFWKPINLVKAASKRPYKGSNKRQKFEYMCNQCGNYFPDKEVAVHHIKEVGSLKGFDDLPDFVRRLFCETDGLEVLCNSCHKKIHNNI